MTDHDLQQGANAGAWSGKELNLVQRQERGHGRGIPELTVRPIGFRVVPTRDSRTAAKHCYSIALSARPNSERDGEAERLGHVWTLAHRANLGRNNVRV
jgi:hypothetical protein